ncbi:Shedu anti-phage system protein SduA domain-containing protein [Streptomyces klenkii]|nr:Shedu anti-phage system protein SduA domain-containing protein [Streptomyces klenkii]
MDVRSDWALEKALGKARAATSKADAQEAIDAVQAYMDSGTTRKYRGGQQLLTLLADARRRSAEVDEWETVRILQDCLYYAQGQLLKPDFEEKYRLFQKGPRNRLDRDWLTTTIRSSNTFWAEIAREFLNGRPEATARELLAHVESVGLDVPFLEAPADRPTQYRIPKGRAERALWIQRVLRDRVYLEDDTERLGEDAGEAARRIASSPEALAVLAADRDGQTLLWAAEWQRRSAALARLRKVAEDPTASEHDLQRALRGQYWIFGGRFIGEAEHRRLVPGNEVDIPLIRGDGALHVVELKQASRLKNGLVKRHRNGWVPSHEVNDAVGQVVHYLIGLDEHRERIREEFGYETRRATGVVLIGHPHAHPEIPEEVLNETLRVHNTHRNRVEVLTYKELVDNAERSLGHGAT